MLRFEIHSSKPNIIIMICVALILLPSAFGQIEEYGSITNAADMNQGRYNHTATLLNDGRVLVTGGTADGTSSLSSCEVYNVGSDTWESIPDMSIPRMRHTASLLPDGHLLLTGGYNSNNGGHPSLFKHFGESISHSSCEIYDPTESRWRDTVPLSTGRFWHCAITLLSGDVLVIGGMNVTTGLTGSCEMYLHDENRWDEVASMNIPRVRFTTTLLHNGNVLITGGHNGVEKIPSDECEIYDPFIDQWRVVSPMNKARGYHSAVRLEDGSVLISGGFSGPGNSDWIDSEQYDPSTDEWVLKGDTSFPRHNHETFLLTNGDVVMLGGSNCQTGGCHSSLEHYDPVTGEWSDALLLVTARKWTASVMLKDGRILMTGGKACYNASKIVDAFIGPDWSHDESGDTSESLSTGMVPLMAVSLGIVLLLYKNRYQLKRG